MSRLARVAWLSLALLSLFTLTAGVTVARLLPARLALWRVPYTASAPLAPAAQVLAPARAGPGSAGPAPGSSPFPASLAPATPAGVTAAIGGLLSRSAFGPDKAGIVTNLSTGQVLYARDAGTGFEPASTTKLATAVATLTVLGPAARLHTRVLAGPGHGPVVLVGGGDPTLTAGPPPASDYPRPATLAGLARKTAAALRAQHRHAVRLSYNGSRYTGPGLAAGWSPSYISTGNVTQIQALEVDQGRLTTGGTPQDADDPGNFRPRTAAPAADAARAFSTLLSEDGIKVRGPVRATARHTGTVLASVASPPVAQMVQWMLMESNNVIAENLARQVAISTGHTASFRGAAAAEESVLRAIGVPAGISLVDGSGLSPRDRISPAALVKLVGLAAAPEHPRLRAAITGLPVAGFAGTLASGGSVFGTPGRAGLGMIRAKTGNLNTVAALAGVAYASNGQLLGFAFMADHLPPGGLNPAASGMVHLATVLAGCGCH